MALCFKRRLKFIHIPKTGGTAVIQALQLDPQGYHDDWNLYPPETRDFISFAVVRDPIDRFVSQFNFGMSDRSYWHIKGTKSEFADYQIMKDMTMNEIAEDLRLPFKERRLKHSGWWPQSWFVCDHGGRVRVHYVLRQEQLERDLNLMLGELGQPPVSLSIVNTSERRLDVATVRSDPAFTAKLVELYKTDYRAFGYVEPIFRG
jgi:hypothetical protein